MRGGPGTGSRKPASVLFVDLMASTFAVLFLVLVVSLLSEAQDVAEAELGPPRPRSATDFKLRGATLVADEDHTDHPFAQSYETYGQIEVWDDEVGFYEEDPATRVTVEADRLGDEDSLFRRFLSRLLRRQPRDPLKIDIYGNGAFHKVFDLLGETSLDYIWETIPAVDEDGPGGPEDEEDGKDEISVAGRRPELQDAKTAAVLRALLGSDDLGAQGLEQSAGLGSPKLELLLRRMATRDSAAARYLAKYYDRNRHLDLWEYLTRKIYRQRGYDVHYETHRDQLNFYHHDLDMLLDPIREARQDQRGIWLFLLALVVGSIFFYREIVTENGRNRL